MPHVLEKANLTAGALLCLCAMAVLNATAQDTPRYSLREMDMHIHCGLERRLPLTDLAAVATARSVPHFCTQFRREVGLTPAAYHLQLRLNAAREALRQPAIDVTTAAQQYGFSSSQHFSTQFRRSFGITPRSWRQGVG